jgi:hypothetical protein
MKQHSLLSNGFLIRKYTWPMLSDDFADRHIPMEMTGATVEELFSMWSVPKGYKRDGV